MSSITELVAAARAAHANTQAARDAAQQTAQQISAARGYPPSATGPAASSPAGQSGGTA